MNSQFSTLFFVDRAEVNRHRPSSRHFARRMDSVHFEKQITEKGETLHANRPKTALRAGFRRKRENSFSKIEVQSRRTAQNG